MQFDWIKYQKALKKSQLIRLKGFANNFCFEKIKIWQRKKLLETDIKSKKNLINRFYWYYKKAGKPQIYRNPYFFFYNKIIYNLIKDKKILNIVSKLLKSDEICLHGLFNIRFVFPKVKKYKTNWHQDISSLPGLNKFNKKTTNKNIITMWIPLVNITSDNAPLVFLKSKSIKDKIYSIKDGVVNKKIVDKISKREKILLKERDILFFKSTAIHKTSNNNSAKTRWAIDLRFEDISKKVSKVSKKYGLILRSKKYKLGTYSDFKSKIKEKHYN
jgi:hypothetical protein